MNKLKIVYKHVDEIIPYVNNPRKISQNAIDNVASSIKNFGFKVPIIIDKDNEIVAGHTRILAAKKLGMEEVPYTLSGDFVNVYDSLTEASLKTGISDSTIGMVCTNKRQSGGGYYWVYVKDDNVPQKIDIEINIKTINESKPKPVIQFDKDGNLINEYQSIREASRQTNIVLSSIVENCKGKRKSAGGYIWEYKTNNEV